MKDSNDIYGKNYGFYNTSCLNQTEGSRCSFSNQWEWTANEWWARGSCFLGVNMQMGDNPDMLVPVCLLNSVSSFLLGLLEGK